MEFVTTSQTGSLFRGNTADYHAHRFYLHGYFEWRNWAVALAVCSGGDTIVEVGANIGTETVGFRDIVGPTGAVHAFEPMPKNAEALRRLVKLNGWHNVHVYEVALGAEAAEVTFVLPTTPWMSGVGFVAMGSGMFAEKYESCQVPMIPLDDLRDRIGPVKALFIDTEGAEIAVLQGARRTISETRPLIVIEASPKLLVRAGFSLQELQDILGAWGYNVFEIGRLGLRQPKAFLRGRAANWCCLPEENENLRSRVTRHVFLCGALPCLAGVNPMSHRRASR